MDHFFAVGEKSVFRNGAAMAWGANPHCLEISFLSAAPEKFVIFCHWPQDLPAHFPVRRIDLCLGKTLD